MYSSFEYLLSLEIKQNLYLQENLIQMESFLENLSTLMSPVMILNVWVPLIGIFDTDLMLDLILLIPTATFSSTLLKWIIPEPRPYWWVAETKLYKPKTRPKFRILPCTCETASGTFSTHSMIFTIFLVVIGMKLLNMYREQNDCEERNSVRYGVYSIAFLGSIIMWISRMHLFTHFLHQCIMGSALGMAIVYYYYENYDFQENVNYTAQKDGLLFALASAAVVAIVYGIMIVIGHDLQWPVRLAFKWCLKPNYLNPNTTPVYAIIRDLATLFGVAAASPLMGKKEQAPNLYLSAPIFLAIIAASRALEILTPTAMGRFAFLSYVFVKNFLFCYSVAHIAPKYTAEQCQRS